MQLPIFRLTFSIAFLCLSGISQATQSADPLSTLPADPRQTTQPQWVKAVPPYPLTRLSKAEVDLNSVKQGDNGQISVWERDTHEEPQLPSTDYTFQIDETHYLIDCSDGKYTYLVVNTRRANGDLVRSISMPVYEQEHLADVPPDSLISAEVTLACVQAKKNWPIDQHYDLHIKPKQIVTIASLTAQEKEKIDQAITQRKEVDKRNTPVVEPLLTAQNGKNVCHTMNGVDGNPSSYELCDAQGMFSHDVYSVRTGGIIFLRGIDDDTTKGIDGMFDGASIRLQCEPVNQLVDYVTNETIEAAIQVDKMHSKKISFDDELRFEILNHVIEIGRHCTLSNTDGVMAKLDVVSP